MKKYLFIPSSYSKDVRDKRLRVFKIGILGRAAAIFRINRIVIYDDKDAKIDGKKEGAYMRDVLEYMECPQYLRKHLYAMRKDFAYIGALPPLRTKGHPKEDEEEEIREGVCTGGDKVYVGLEKEIRVREKLKKNQRVLVDIRTGELVDKKRVGYWSFEVEDYESLKDALLSNIPDLLIGTSRLGLDIRRVQKKVKKSIMENRSIGVVFGSPFYRGLEEIMTGEGMEMSEFDYYLNFIPDQGSRVVKVEEAVTATLSILNLLEE